MIAWKAPVTTVPSPLVYLVQYTLQGILDTAFYDTGSAVVSYIQWMLFILRHKCTHTYTCAHTSHTRTLTSSLPSLPQVYGATTHTISDPTPYTEVNVSIQTASLWSLNPQAVTGTFQSFPEREWLPNLHGNHLHITMQPLQSRLHAFSLSIQACVTSIPTIMYLQSSYS